METENTAIELMKRLRDRAERSLPGFDWKEKKRHTFLVCCEADRAAQRLFDAFQRSPYAGLTDYCGSAEGAQEFLSVLTLQSRFSALEVPPVFLLFVFSQPPTELPQLLRHGENELPLRAAFCLLPEHTCRTLPTWLRPGPIWSLNTRSTEEAVQSLAPLLALGAHEIEFPEKGPVQLRGIQWSVQWQYLAAQMGNRLRLVLEGSGTEQVREDFLRQFAPPETLPGHPGPLSLPMFWEKEPEPSGKRIKEVLEALFQQVEGVDACQWLQARILESLQASFQGSLNERFQAHCERLPLHFLCVSARQLTAEQIALARGREIEAERSLSEAERAAYGERLLPPSPALQTYLDRWETLLLRRAVRSWWEALQALLCAPELTRQSQEKLTRLRQCQQFLPKLGDPPGSADLCRENWRAFDPIQVLESLPSEPDGFQEEALRHFLEEQREQIQRQGGSEVQSLILFDAGQMERLTSLCDRSGNKLINAENGILRTVGESRVRLVPLPCLGGQRAWVLEVKRWTAEFREEDAADG